MTETSLPTDTRSDTKKCNRPNTRICLYIYDDIDIEDKIVIVCHHSIIYTVLIGIKIFNRLDITN
jgi:hypothetical protein